MPKDKKSNQINWRKLWKDWGFFLVLIAVIMIVGIVVLIVNTSRVQRRIEIDPAAPYRIYFTQGDGGAPMPDGLEAVILKDVGNARQSVEVATPGLDLPGLADALIAAHGRGVQVRVLGDAAAHRDPAVSAVTERLRAVGIAVVLREAPGALGGAFIVVDRAVLWAGSWDLSRQGLEEDDAVVLRWNFSQMAGYFYDEFEEMFVHGVYGVDSPPSTGSKYLAVAIPSATQSSPLARGIWTYFMPEDDPFGHILQSMARVQGDIVVLAGGLDDTRLGDRLIAESSRTDIAVLGLLGHESPESPVIAALRSGKGGWHEYQGSGVLRHSVIVVDGETVCIFSQPLIREGLDQNDGYVIILVDREVGAIMRRELGRLSR